MIDEKEGTEKEEDELIKAENLNDLNSITLRVYSPAQYSKVL